jgi:hypothetical protein
VAIAARLIAAGADVNAQDEDGRPPVFIAEFEGQEECTGFLLEHGASIGLTDNRDYTLLHLAALHGRIGIVQKLLDLGADPNAESTSEFTPLDGARGGGHPEIAELLLARGASRMRDSEGGTGDWIRKGDVAAERGDLGVAIECFDRALKATRAPLRSARRVRIVPCWPQSAATGSCSSGTRRLVNHATTFAALSLLRGAPAECALPPAA